MKYFTLRELVKTNTGLDNSPNAEVIQNLEAVVAHIMDPLRIALGEPIRITSGYRSPAVNTAVKGAKHSQHTKGEAIDFVCSDNARAFRYIRDHLPYDQLIWEKGNDKQPDWVHVSYKRGGNNRKQILHIR